MPKQKKNRVSEEDVLKALGDLEEDAEQEKDMKKSKGSKKKALPGSTKEANGGFSQKDSDDTEGFETNAEENDPVAKGGDEDEEEADEQDDAAEEDADEGDEEQDDADAEDDAEEEQEDEEEAPAPTARKSLKDRIKQNDTVRKGIEVSDFLKELTDEITTSNEDVAKSVNDFMDRYATDQQRVKKALVTMGTLIVGIAKSLKVIEDSPAAVRKSMLNKSDVEDRFEEEKPQFSKSEVLDVMNSLVEQNKLPPAVVATYETTEFIAPEWQPVIEKALKAA